MADLAAIIEEGEQAEQSYRDAKPFTAAEIGAGDWCHRFYVQHGPTLLAVAKAAVEMRKTYGKLASLHSVDSGVPTWDVDADGELVQTGRTPDIDKPDCEHCRVLAAFDAAVRGEGKEVPRG